jgi:hypothetical protein
VRRFLLFLSILVLFLIGAAHDSAAVLNKLAWNSASSSDTGCPSGSQAASTLKPAKRCHCRLAEPNPVLISVERGSVRSQAERRREPKPWPDAVFAVASQRPEAVTYATGPPGLPGCLEPVARPLSRICVLRI